MILKIDVQGAAAVKARASNALLIFLVPPSLEDALRAPPCRATETADELESPAAQRRRRAGPLEDYDHVVVNETGEVDRTAAAIDAILDAEQRSPSTAQGPTLTASMFEPNTVEVAVDAVGAAGGRTYTYTVPDRSRRPRLPARRSSSSSADAEALGIVLGPVAAPDGMTTDLKPILERVRSEGPLLPPLQLAPGPRHRPSLPRAGGDGRSVPRCHPGRSSAWSTSPGSPRAADGAATRAGRRTSSTIDAATPLDAELLARVAEAGPLASRSPA